MKANVFSREEWTINLWIRALWSWIDSHVSAFCRCSEGQVGTLTTPSQTVVWLPYRDSPKEEGDTDHLLKCKGWKLLLSTLKNTARWWAVVILKGAFFISNTLKILLDAEPWVLSSIPARDISLLQFFLPLHTCFGYRLSTNLSPQGGIKLGKNPCLRFFSHLSLQG